MFADRTHWNLASNRLADALSRHRASGRRLLDLTASNPTECGFHYDEETILQSLRQPGSLEYHPDPRGLCSAREAVSRYYASLGATITAEDIILTTSTSEAYSFVFRLLANPGDEILIPAPSYPLFDFLADIQDVKARPYPLFYDHGWEIDFQTLENSITPRTRAVIVVHPNNPTGHYTRRSEMVKLAEFCTSRELAIVADEVFLDFSLADEKPASFLQRCGALTFVMSGLSKISGLPQMKLAWLVACGPDDQRRKALARLEVIADTYLSLNTPVQLAAAVLLDQRHSFQKQVLARIQANLRELDSQLAERPSVSRLLVEGGWYSVLRVPATRFDQDLAIDLLEKHGVYVHPGHFYGFPEEGFIVVSLITPADDFSEGIQKLLEVVAS